MTLAVMSTWWSPMCPIFVARSTPVRGVYFIRCVESATCCGSLANPDAAPISGRTAAARCAPRRPSAAGRVRPDSVGHRGDLDSAPALDPAGRPDTGGGITWLGAGPQGRVEGATRGQPGPAAVEFLCAQHDFGRAGPDRHQRPAR